MLSTLNLTAGERVSDHREDTGVDLEYLVRLYPVWRRVFRHLGSPDLINCMKAFSVWQKWLSTTQSTFILPEIMPFLMKELAKRDFLSCRLVCHRWKDDVDKIYQTHSSNVNFASLKFPPSLSGFPSDVGSRGPDEEDFGVSFSSADSIAKFLEDMEPYEGNPFPGRRIKLTSSCSDEEYRDSMKVLLQRYGGHVWYADINIYEDDGVPIRGSLSRHFRDYLARLPNLKRLVIRTTPDEDENAIDEEEEEDEMDELMANFKDYLLQTSPLELAQLETLQVLNNHHNVDELIKSILAGDSVKRHLKRLHLRRNSYRSIYDLECLEELEVKNFQVEDLPLLRKAKPPLKRISLGLHSRKGFQKVNIVSVFGELERFGGTLKEVHVLTTVFSGNCDGSFRLNLPNLEKLTLSLDGSLDYFLGLKCLKQLSVYDPVLCPWGDEGEVVEYHGFQTRMYESNIWRLMPGLEKFVCGRWKEDKEFGRKYNRSTMQAKN